MKKTLLLIITLFITGICLGQTYDQIVETYDNGFPKVIKTYKVSKGRLESVKEITWYVNGQKKEEKSFKDGERYGLHTKWYDNGQKKEEGTWKDGKRDRLWTAWLKNGQKKEEATFKDGERYGLHTKWYDNGKKRAEGTFKDGELISEQCWDEAGNETEECN